MSKGWGSKDSQDWSEKQYGERSSGKEVSRTEHQARNDYQDSGSPFGSLSNRDRSSKSDTKSKGSSSSSNDSSSSSDSSSGGGCYIATATLKLTYSQQSLCYLREWRDEILRRTKYGNKLEKFYDLTGPVVSSKVKDNKILAASFLFPFVLPATFLCKFRKKTKLLKPIIDLLIYAIFLVGLLYGSFNYFIIRTINYKKV